MSRGPEVQVGQGSKPIGGDARKRPGRDFRIIAADFSQAFQSEPLPIVWGRARRAGTYIVPIWKLRSVPVTTTVGK